MWFFRFLFLTVYDRGDKARRQWLTRILTLASLPFELTLALDTNVKVCSCVLRDAMKTWHEENIDVITNAMHPSKRQWGNPNRWFGVSPQCTRTVCSPRLDCSAGEIQRYVSPISESNFITN
jgi:hypothetical protein